MAKRTLSKTEEITYTLIVGAYLGLTMALMIGGGL